MEDQWWSMYRINPEEHGLWALKISYLKLLIFAALSVIVAYFFHGFL
ncbi:hypothetical protein [Niallia oryzisoli]